MTTTQPIVLETNDVLECLKFVLDKHSPPSTLVVCSSKTAFLEALHTAARDQDFKLRNYMWKSPTLRLLSSSRTLKLAFCTDITHLRAYLAAYSSTVSDREVETDTALRSKDVQPILALLNPIQLHRPTSAFSAQGLNRTFSLAVEAAHQTESKLIMAECLPSEQTPGEPQLGQETSASTEVSSAPADPWDEEVSILNVTTKRLGELSVGRTVKTRTIAERWCTFETPIRQGDIHGGMHPLLPIPLPLI